MNGIGDDYIMMEEKNTMERSVQYSEIIRYLQNYLTAWLHDKEKYGADDRLVQKEMTRLLACKNMAEVLMGVPVNLTLDGTVTTGY